MQCRVQKQRRLLAIMRGHLYQHFNPIRTAMSTVRHKSFSVFFAEKNRRMLKYCIRKQLRVLTVYIQILNTGTSSLTHSPTHILTQVSSFNTRHAFKSSPLHSITAIFLPFFPPACAHPLFWSNTIPWTFFLCVHCNLCSLSNNNIGDPGATALRKQQKCVKAFKII